MARFFVEPEQMQPGFIVLTGENAQHAKVLRLKNGSMIMRIFSRKKHRAARLQ